MSSQQETYSPAQYLDAGYRAELAGERERAAQFYVYLAEAYPGTPEGEAARGGLMRLGFGPRGMAEPHTHVTAPNRPAGRPSNGAATSADPPSQPAHASALAARPVATTAQQSRIRLADVAHMSRTAHAPAERTGHSEQRAPQDAPQDRDRDMRLPEVVARRAREMAEAEQSIAFAPRYRAGRILAVLFTWGGWLVVSGGIALLVLSLVATPAFLAGRIAGLPAGIVTGACVFFTGLATTLAGQVALAIFDHADAVREVRAIVRVRADL